MNAEQIRQHMIDELTNHGEFEWDEKNPPHDIPDLSVLRDIVAIHGEFEPMPQELYDPHVFDLPGEALAALVRKPGPGAIVGNGDLYCYSGDGYVATHFRFVKVTS